MTPTFPRNGVSGLAGAVQPTYLDEDGPNHPDVLDFGIPNLVEDDECPQPVELEDIDDPRNGWL